MLIGWISRFKFSKGLFIDTPRMAIIIIRDAVMMEFLVETVIISFTMGGLIGGIISLKLVTPQKIAVTPPENTLGSDAPK